MKLITTIEVLSALIGTILAVIGLWPYSPILALSTVFLTLFITLVVMRVCSWFVAVEQDLAGIREVTKRLNARPQ